DAATSKKVDCGSSAETVVIWHIVVSLMSGVIIGLFLAYIVLSAHRRWFRNRKPQKYCEPQETEVDTTYQELDLSKMNTEDNYQSLRVNAANNDDWDAGSAKSNDDHSHINKRLAPRMQTITLQVGFGN
ncbi:Hypothetical predicted protein, partial [Paramuricea clavata]